MSRFNGMTYNLHYFKNTERTVKRELVLYNLITAFSIQSHRWQNEASKGDAHLLIKYSLMESLTFSWQYCICFTLNDASHCDQNEKMSQVGHSFLHIPENRGHAGFVFSNFSPLYNYDGLWEFLKRLQVLSKAPPTGKPTCSLSCTNIILKNLQ